MNYPELRKVQLKSREVRDEVARSHDSVYGIASDGIAICRKCCKTERASIGFTYGTDGWALVASQENYEDNDLCCGHCGDKIDPVYA